MRQIYVPKKVGALLFLLQELGLNQLSQSAP
jgi:hypothetical protein